MLTANLDPVSSVNVVDSSSYRDILHMDVGLYLDDLELEAGEESQRSMRPWQTVIEVRVLVVRSNRDHRTVPEHDFIGDDSFLVETDLGQQVSLMSFSTIRARKWTEAFKPLTLWE